MSKMKKGNFKGITLIELLVAALVLAIAIGGVMQGYKMHLELAQGAREMQNALTDARDMMEKIGSTPHNRIADDFPDGIADGGGASDYRVFVGGYTLAGEQITVSYPNPLMEPLEIIVTVNWSGPRNRQRTVSLSTFKAE